MEMQDVLKGVGYICNSSLAQKITLFKLAGERKTQNIQAMILEGEPGAGKTFLAEAFAKIIGVRETYIQCFPGMGSEHLIIQPNIPAILKNDSDNAINNGLLVTALLQSHKQPVVVIIDEIDKATFEVDSFLLDFLNSGRITNGQEMWVKGDYPIWVFITSNAQRELSEALLNRGRRVFIERPSISEFTKILNVPQTHHISKIYNYFPSFSIRQAKEYLEDIAVLGGEFNKDVLSQYVDVKSIKVKSLADAKLFGENVNFEPDFYKINIKNNALMMREVENNPQKYKLVSGPNGLEVIIRTLVEAERINEIIGFSTENKDIIIPNECIQQEILASNLYDGVQSGLFIVKGNCLAGYKVDDTVYVSINKDILSCIDETNYTF